MNISEFDPSQRRRDIAAQEKSAADRAAEEREKAVAWATFLADRQPTSFNFTRLEADGTPLKIFYPLQANVQLMDEFVTSRSLRYSYETLLQAFEALNDKLAILDPRRDYETKTIDAEGRRQPVPQNKLSVRTQITAAQSVLPADISRETILNWPATTLRMMIRKFGSAQINARLNSGRA